MEKLQSFKGLGDVYYMQIKLIHSNSGKRQRQKKTNTNKNHEIPGLSASGAQLLKEFIRLMDLYS